MNFEESKNSLALLEESLNALEAVEISNKIESLQEAVGACEQVEIPVEHEYKNGKYLRKICIKKDTVLIGKVHKHDYIDIMLSGDITVVTTEGPKRYTGYNVLDGKAGRKRAGYAHEDTYWVTIHDVDECDSGENYIDTQTFDSVEEYRIAADQASYKKLLASINRTEEQVQEEMDSVEVHGLPREFLQHILVARSKLHGTGVFSRYNFSYGELIGPAKILGNKTILGRYVNHSATPNAEMRQVENGDVALVTLRAITAGEELTVDYSATLNLTTEALCLQ